MRWIQASCSKALPARLISCVLPVRVSSLFVCSPVRVRFPAQTDPADSLVQSLTREVEILRKENMFLRRQMAAAGLPVAGLDAAPPLQLVAAAAAPPGHAARPDRRDWQQCESGMLCVCACGLWHGSASALTVFSPICRMCCISIYKQAAPAEHVRAQGRSRHRRQSGLRHCGGPAAQPPRDITGESAGRARAGKRPREQGGGARGALEKTTKVLIPSGVMRDKL